MRVLFVTSLGIEFASTRLRIHQFLPYLERNGVAAVVRPFLSSRMAPVIYERGQFARKIAVTAAATLQRVVDVARSTRFDLVYVMREAFPFGPPLFERALRAATGRLIFDFDDAIWLPSSIYQNPLDRLRDWRKPAKIIGFADHVVVGSPFHLDYAANYVSDVARVSVIPTVVDPSYYSPPTAPHSGAITVGWIGTPRNTGYLVDFVPVMRALHARNKHIRFLFVGAKPFPCGELPVTFKEWRLANEIADIQSFDIGIMPLPDDAHARGKCGLKLIQYMSCGVPVVSSPVGINTGIVDNGRCGLLAATPGEWKQAISELAANPTLRARYGREGRRRVVEHYSSDVMAPRLLQIICETVASRRAQPAIPVWD